MNRTSWLLRIIRVGKCTYCGDTFNYIVSKLKRRNVKVRIYSNNEMTRQTYSYEDTIKCPGCHKLIYRDEYDINNDSPDVFKYIGYHQYQ